MENSTNKTSVSKEISITEIIEIVLKYYRYLLTKWKIIVVFGVTGALIGLAASFLIKPKYTAKMSFALVEKSSGGGGLADLASSFGFSGLLGGGSNGAFSGDNLLEIIKSRKATELALLSPVEYKGKTVTLMQMYMDFSGIKESLKSVKNNPQLKNLDYPVGITKEQFNRVQDSVIMSVYAYFQDKQLLKVSRKDKKVSIVNVEFTSKNEMFSKYFVESLINQTYAFYRATKTAQSQMNVDMMQVKADSVKALYESALYKGAAISTVNINQAFQTAAVPRLKQESDAKLYVTVYAEILKNLETLKLDLARETPLVQIIDEPDLPLKKDKLGIIKGVLLGGIIGVVLILFFLISYNFVNLLIKEQLKS